jgi:uncharacterized membrane protein SirB2
VNTEAPALGRANAAFALSAAIIVLFDTLVACVKDAYVPLKNLLALPTGSDWLTQGLVDVVLFILLGLVLSKTNWAERLHPNRLISFLIFAVVVAGVGLFSWYALY